MSILEVKQKYVEELIFLFSKYSFKTVEHKNRVIYKTMKQFFSCLNKIIKENKVSELNKLIMESTIEKSIIGTIIHNYKQNKKNVTDQSRYTMSQEYINNINYRFLHSLRKEINNKIYSICDDISDNCAEKYILSIKYEYNEIISDIILRECDML